MDTVLQVSLQFRLRNMTQIIIQPLDLLPGMLAHTLIIYNDKKYEVITNDIAKTVDDETAEFWEEMLKDYPFETIVYKCVSASAPYTELENTLADLVEIAGSTELRRDLELGDLYISRSSTEDAAAIEHDSVVQEFKSDSILLLTQNERVAIYGPAKFIL